MYRDNGYTTDYDSMSVYVNTSASTTGATLLINLPRYLGFSPTAPANGWYQYSVPVPVTFNTATNYIIFKGISYFGNDIYLDDVNVSHISPCAGHPTAGSIVPVAPCSGAAFNLTLTGNSTSLSGLTYQWQSSPTGTPGSWTNVGANAATITQTITAATYYRSIITCTNSSQSDTTAPYLVNLASFYYCYCASASTYLYYSNIGNVKLIRQHASSAPVNAGDTVLNNGNASPLANNATAIQFYTPYADSANVAVASLYPDSTYKLIITDISNSSSSFVAGPAAAWIDYNHNQVFDANELVVSGSTVAGTQALAASFTIPHTALFGITGMRLITSPYGTAPLNPCGAYSYGETEDYLVNINYSPCSGAPLAGTLLGTDTAMCPGYTFSLLDTTYQKQRGNLTYSWQVSNDGGYTYNHVPGSLGKDTLNNILFTNSVKYRFRIICQNTHDTSYSNIFSIALKAPYKCYCFSMATGGSLDTSDLGTLIIGNNLYLSGGGGVNGYSSGPHVLNPQAYRARTNYTDLTPTELYADSTYRLGLYEIIKTALHADARISVFMDFNRDLQYEAGQGGPNDERIYTGVNNASAFLIDTMIRIPDLVIPDQPTGMRVIVNNDVNPNSPANLGCGGYTSGETEDYVVIFRRPLPTGIVSVGNITGVNIYPNPTGGRFTVKANATKEIGTVGLTVTDLTGHVLVSKSYDNAGTQFSTDVDITGVAAGVYLIQLQAGTQKSVSKLIVR